MRDGYDVELVVTPDTYRYRVTRTADGETVELSFRDVVGLFPGTTTWFDALDTLRASPQEAFRDVE